MHYSGIGLFLLNGNVGLAVVIFGWLNTDNVYVHKHTYVYILKQGDQKVSVHLMITIQKVTSNVQSVPCQSPDIY
jgi:hypothetical protein